jgi:hypothetical protein
MKKYLTAIKVVIFLLITLAGLIQFGPQKAQAADLAKSISKPPSDLECHWVNSAHIICTYNSGTGADIITAGNRKDETDCGGVFNVYTCIDFWFASLESYRADYVIFKGQEDEGARTDRHLSFTTDNPGAAAWFQRSEGNTFDWEAPPKGTPTNVVVNKVKNAQKKADDGKCSVLLTSKCDGLGNTSSNDTSKGVSTDLFRQQASLLAAKELSLSDCNDKAPIGFIFCPLLDSINGAIASLIGGGELVEGQRSGLLVSFLQLPPLLGQGSTFGQVVGNIVTIANIIFVFVFLVLIFSSSLPFGLDNYTIKKTLPKFIAAVILTQFSVVICGVIVDVFNLLGNAIPNVIYFLASGTAAAGNSGQQVVERLGNSVTTGLIGGAVAVGSVIGYILIFIFAFIALIAGLIAIVYMIIRYFVLYMLVLVAPLAFVAWVIPGTEKFFFNWWKNFIRLNAMYVTIMALLSGSLLLSSLLQSLFPQNDPASLIPSLIPLVALMLIPKTLKWTTQGMAALGSLGAVAGKMNAGVKPAKSMTQKGLQKGKNLANEKRQEQAAIQFGKGRTKTGALLAGRLPTAKGKLLTSRESEAFVQERNKNNRASLKYTGSQLDYQGYGQELIKVARGEGSKTLGVKSGDEAMQIAAISELAGRGDWGDLRNGVYGTVGEKVFSQGIEPYIGDAATKAPDMVKRDNGAAFANISADKITDLDKSTVATMISYINTAQTPPGPGATPEQIAEYDNWTKTKTNLESSARTIHSDPKLSAKLTGEVRAELNGQNIPDGSGGFLRF